MSDISKPLLVELDQIKELDFKTFDKLVTEAIQTIMEGLNGRYYHVSGLSYKVTWRFDP
jgi:hypothetical protein